MISAAGTCAIGAAIFEPTPNQLTGDVIYWIGLSIVLATGFRFFIMVKAYELSDHKNPSLVLILEPVWVMTIAIVIYQESINIEQFLGCCLVLLALLSQSTRIKTRRHSPDKI